MDLQTLIWPLAVLLFVLILLRQLRDDLKPIFSAITKGVADQAAHNSEEYARAFLFGLTASASAFIDVFQHLDGATMAAMSWHQYATLWVKVLNPFLVAVLAYATQNKFQKPAGGPTP